MIGGGIDKEVGGTIVTASQSQSAETNSNVSLLRIWNSSKKYQLLGVLCYAAVCHGLFLIAVAMMAWSIYSGLQFGIGPFEGVPRVIANSLLIFQFPLLHSFFLSKRGRSYLSKVVPGNLGTTLSTTTYVIFASLQLILVFGLWSPAKSVWWEPAGSIELAFAAAYLGSWLFLMKAMADAGLGVQLGSTGWTAALRGEKPSYNKFSAKGSFRYCRQPMYLAFMLILWTAPVWTADRFVLAIVWSFYLYFGPKLKERRYVGWYGNSFSSYQQSTPYFLPRLLFRKARS